MNYIIKSVDMKNKTVSIVPDPICQPYFIPSGSNIDISKINTSGQILTTNTSGPIWINPLYNLHSKLGTIKLNEEEFIEAMEVAYQHIIKKRQYNKDFDTLVDSNE